MKAYVIREPGRGLEAWQLIDLPDPKPGFGQVLVKVHATSLNYRDLLVARGVYGQKTKPDCIALSDGAGEVVALGEGVRSLQKGDRVAATFFQTWQAGPITANDHHQALGGAIDGMLAQQVVLNAEGLVKIPDHLSYEEASTLPCAALTAWHALMETGKQLKPGASVLTLGTGGVSIFAAQFAKAAGLRVIGTSSHDEKLERLSALGVEDCINYKKIPEWDKEVLRYTDKQGVDQVIEVGGAGTLPQSLSATTLGGTVSLIGVLTGVNDAINPVQVLFKSIRLQGIYVGSREMFLAMNRAVSLLRIKPVIDSIFEFAEAKKALQKLASGAHFGKIVIRVD